MYERVRDHALLRELREANNRRSRGGGYNEYLLKPEGVICKFTNLTFNEYENWIVSEYIDEFKDDPTARATRQEAWPINYKGKRYVHVTLWCSTVIGKDRKTKEDICNTFPMGTIWYETDELMPYETEETAKSEIARSLTSEPIWEETYRMKQVIQQWRNDCGPEYIGK